MQKEFTHLLFWHIYAVKTAKVDMVNNAITQTFGWKDDT